MHVDSAACSRQSFAVIDAAAQHARHEAEVGGYVAAEAAAPVLDAGRAAVRALTGMTDADVVFTTGSNNALDILLGDWTGDAHGGLPARRVRAQSGDHGAARLRDPRAAGRRLRADWTSTRPPQRWPRIRLRSCTSRCWAATAGSCSRPATWLRLPAARRTDDRRRCAGLFPSGLRRHRRRRAVLVVA